MIRYKLTIVKAILLCYITFMEVAILTKSSIRIKGKTAVLVVDPQDKSESNAALVFSKPPESVNTIGAEVVLNGPGEYEIGGVKITGMRNELDLMYSMSVDSVSLLLGKLTTLEKMQQKLKESNILVVNCDNVGDPAFLTSLVTNVIIFYGEHAGEVGKAFGQDNVKHLSKYASTIEKLPAEVETVILE